MRRFAVALALALAACSSASPEKQSEAEAAALPDVKERENDGMSLAEKCRVTTRSADLLAEAGSRYSANQQRRAALAYCSKKPNEELLKKARQRVTEFEKTPARDTRNRCAQHELTAMAYQEALDGPNFDRWMKRTRDYCEANGWRYEV